MEIKKKAEPVDESGLKVILGLKLRQLRANKRLSLADLAALTGISVSYLNEIEKGKKLPRADKVSVLASALEVSHDWLLSKKIGKKLAPVAEVLQSRLIKELLMDVFGVDRGQLLEMLSRVPARSNAFLNTLIDISRNYGMRVENLYLSALRSYQEMHENYFEDIETAVIRFVRQQGLDPGEAIEWEILAGILTNEYQYEVVEDGLARQPELSELRSVLLAGKNPRLLLNGNLNRVQKAFILGRELGFQFMNLVERPHTTTWLDFESFEQVLNNFRASYFSAALMINADRMVGELSTLFGRPTFEPEKCLALINQFNVSPEIFAQRLTNLLPRYLGIQELFFLRFSHRNGTEEFELTKEMHLAGLHNPHANMMQEHYCRRWISINILKCLSTQLKKGLYAGPLCMAQRSRYFGNEKEYLLISFALPAMAGAPVHHSISIGLLLNNQVRKRVMFWNDPSIPVRMVGETCQRCPASECTDRVAEPVVLQRLQKITVMKTALASLSDR